MTEDRLDEIVEATTTGIDETGCDTALLSKEESVEFYKGVRSHCNQWIQTLEDEIARG